MNKYAVDIKVRVVIDAETNREAYMKTHNVARNIYLKQPVDVPILFAVPNYRDLEKGN